MTLLAAAGVLALGAGTAEAAVKLTHGQDWAEATSTAVRAFDGESDGNGVYADVYLTNGAHRSVWDGNGAEGTPSPWTSVGGKIAKFRVCEDHVGCSDWRTNPS